LIPNYIGDIEKVQFQWHSNFGLGKHELNVDRISLVEMFDTEKG